MPLFLLGLVLGALSGGISGAVSHSAETGLIAGGIAAIATWLGWATFLFIDDL